MGKRGLRHLWEKWGWREKKRPAVNAVLRAAALGHAIGREGQRNRTSRGKLRSRALSMPSTSSCRSASKRCGSKGAPSRARCQSAKLMRPAHALAPLKAFGEMSSAMSELYWAKRSVGANPSSSSQNWSQRERGSMEKVAATASDMRGGCWRRWRRRWRRWRRWR